MRLRLLVMELIFIGFAKIRKLFLNQLTGSDFKLLIQTMIKQSRYGKKYMRLTFIFRHFNTIETNTIFLL